MTLKRLPSGEEEDSHELLVVSNGASLAASSSAALGCAERVRIYANRVQFSRAYAYAYAAVLVLSVCLFAWVIIEMDYPLGHAVKFWVFVVLDGIVTVFVLLEIAVSLLAQGRQNFCRQWSNHADLGVAVLCVVALMMHVLGPVDMLDLDVEELESVVLVVRYVAQLARLALIVKKVRRQARKRQLEVHLDTEEPPDDDPDLDGSAAAAHGDPRAITAAQSDGLVGTST